MSDVPQQPASQRKQATILFADLSGFTALSETLDPEQVRAVVNRYFERLTAIVQRYGGTIDKYIGDCIMAVFGVPTAHENDPERACRAALEMQRAVRDLAAASETTEALALHIGINSGLVVAAPMGAGACSQFTVMGDAVNLGSRLLHEAEEEEIAVGESTWDSTKHLFDFSPPQFRAIKGKTGKTAFYYLRAATAERPARGRELGTPMVGRHMELGLAEELLAGAAQGQGCLLYVTGEAGIGKSRLVSEIANMAVNRGFSSLFAAAQPLEALDAYGIWSQLLKELTGKCGDEASEGEGIESWISARPALLAHAVALRATMGLPSPEFEVLEEAVRLRKMASAWKSVLHSLQARQPLLLILDDLQWADAPSVDLIGQAAESLPDLAVMLCCVARPEFRHNWSGRSWYRDMTLRHLSDEESTALLSELFGPRKPDTGLLQSVARRGEGNPFYLSELALAVSKRGNAELPPTVYGVIMARVDQLEKEARKILEAASVVGRGFPARVVRAVAEVQGLEVQLERLREAELIYEKKIEPELQYLFKHFLTQEATYNSILIERRKALHREVAQAIEAIYRESLEANYAVLAQHFEQAGDYGKASDYFRLAGECAQQTKSDLAAETLYRHCEHALDKLYEASSSLKGKAKMIALVAASGLAGLLVLPIFTLVTHNPPSRVLVLTSLVVAVIVATLTAALLIMGVKQWSFFVYPDRLRLHSLRRSREIPFAAVEKVELVSWQEWAGWKRAAPTLLTYIAIIGNPFYPHFGVAQSIKPPAQLRKAVRLRCSGLGWRHGCYLEMDNPGPFWDALQRAMRRYQIIHSTETEGRAAAS